MGKQNAFRMAQPIDMMESKENLDMSKRMQRNQKTTTYSCKEENTRRRTIEEMNELVADNPKAYITSKAGKKKKIINKLVQPLKPPYLIYLTRSQNLRWATKLGFQILIAKN